MRRLIAEQMFRLQRVASLGAMILLIANTAILLAEGWFGVILMFVTLGLIALGAANFWVIIARMHDYDERARVTHNVYDNGLLTPKERAILRLVTLPQMWQLVLISERNGVGTMGLRDKISELRYDIENGRIPIEPKR